MTLPFPLELPILPTPRERALLVLMNPDASIESFTAVVEGDPSMTAAVLRAANSAMSFPMRTILSASEGVVRLGTSAVKHLITTTLLRSQFATIEAAGIDADELWRHLLGCALLCEAQARPLASSGAAGEASALAMEQAFTAGLLHDLGRLAMAAQAPNRYRQVVEAAQEGYDAREVERMLFGTDHAEFGRRICERWDLPDEVARAAGEHHEAPPRDLDPAPPTRRTPGTTATTGTTGTTEETEAAAEADTGLALARAVMAGLGIGDGVSRPGKRDPRAEDHPLIASMGGRVEFMHSIRWFRDSTRGRRNAA